MDGEEPQGEAIHSESQASRVRNSARGSLNTPRFAEMFLVIIKAHARSRVFDRGDRNHQFELDARFD